MKRCMAWIAVLWAARLASGETVTMDGVAAHVNDAVITVGEVKEAIAPLVPQLRQVYGGADLEAKIQEVYTEALDDLINAKLILKAYEADTKINKEGVDKYVEKKISDFIQDRFGGDRQEFLKALREEHMSMDEWRRRMRERIIVGMMKSREVDGKVVISPRDVLQVYQGDSARYHRDEQVRVRVILIHGSTNETDRVVREASAKEAWSKLAAGEDFAGVARRLSEDGKADQGGDWGWVDKRDLRSELSGAVAGMKKGAVSDVIRMDGDFYLVKLEDRHEAGPVPFEEVRSAIEKDLRRKEIKRLSALWMERLRKDAYIKVAASSGS